jgi:vacuolar-type H+-ATPase subunit I/STV1
MKVAASPFESPRDLNSPALDAAESARLDETRDDHAGLKPPAVTDVKSNLDSATRESLSRLASLIRGQQKATDEAAEATEEESRRHEKEVRAKEARTERALKIVQGAGEDEAILRERVTGANYPAVERIEKHFREERRKRGVQVYTNQKTRESIEQILTALEDVKPPGSIFDDVDPFRDDDAA